MAILLIGIFARAVSCVIMVLRARRIQGAKQSPLEATMAEHEWRTAAERSWHITSWHNNSEGETGIRRPHDNAWSALQKSGHKNFLNSYEDQFTNLKGTVTTVNPLATVG